MKKYKVMFDITRIGEVLIEAESADDAWDKLLKDKQEYMTNCIYRDDHTPPSIEYYHIVDTRHHKINQLPPNKQYAAHKEICDNDKWRMYGETTYWSDGEGGFIPDGVSCTKCGFSLDMDDDNIDEDNIIEDIEEINQDDITYYNGF